MAKVSFNRFAKLYNNPKDVVQNVNTEICSILKDSGDYFTGYYCVIDHKTRTLSYVNAGHRKVYLLRNGSDDVLEMDYNSYYVGVMPDHEFTSDDVVLKNKDKIVLYTDGIVEARNNSDEMFGDARLSGILKNNRNKSCIEIVECVNKELNEFIDGRQNDDDFAVVVAEVIF
jgi:sigma-B regulation protein RsbU (phosphoserine phosphatase)